MIIVDGEVVIFACNMCKLTLCNVSKKYLTFLNIMGFPSVVLLEVAL